MTISISGVSPLTNGPLYADGSYNAVLPFTNLAVTDNLSQNITLTISQSSVLHTDPGQSDDTVTSVKPGTYGYNYSHSGSDGFTTNPTTGTITIPGSPYTSSTFTAAYLVLTPDSSVHLNGRQIVETTFIITATDDAGSSPVSFVTKAQYGNPIGISATSNLTNGSVGGSHPPTIQSTGLAYSGNQIVTIVASQRTVMHSDVGQADDQVTPVGLGTWSAFNGTSGAITNPPTVDTNSGTITASGSLSPAQGIYDQVTKTYTSHAYSPFEILNGENFTPAAVPLKGNQSLETTFTYSITDAHGDTATTTVVEAFLNPTYSTLTKYVSTVVYVANANYTPFYLRVRWERPLKHCRPLFEDEIP